MSDNCEVSVCGVSTKKPRMSSSAERPTTDSSVRRKTGHISTRMRKVLSEGREFIGDTRVADQPSCRYSLRSRVIESIGSKPVTRGRSARRGRPFTRRAAELISHSTSNQASVSEPFISAAAAKVPNCGRRAAADRSADRADNLQPIEERVEKLSLNSKGRSISTLSPELKMIEDISLVTNVLNQLKITPLREISLRLQKVRLTKENLEQITELILERAISDSDATLNLAEFCKIMAIELKVSDELEGNEENLIQIIARKSQFVFEKDYRLVAEKYGWVSTSIYDTSFVRYAKMKKVGNLKFVGALYNQGLLPPKIMIYCLNQMIRRGGQESVQEFCVLYTLIALKLEWDVRRDQPLSGQLALFFTELRCFTETFQKLNEQTKFIVTEVLACRARILMEQSISSSPEIESDSDITSMPELVIQRPIPKFNALSDTFRPLPTLQPVGRISVSASSNPSIATSNANTMKIVPCRAVSLSKAPVIDFAPKFDEPTQGYRLTFFEGPEAIITATCTGFPYPVFQWAYNEVDIHSDINYLIETDNRNFTSMKIKKADRWFAGEYTVTASNYCGKDTQKFTVEIISKPSPPVGPIILTDIGVDSCKIIWSEPIFDGGSPITGYVVQWLSCQTGLWSQLIEVPTCELEVMNLTQEHKYHFRVSAVNKVGASKTLKTVKPVKIKRQPPPPSAPEQLRVTDENSTGLTIAWDEPTQTDSVTGYVVEYKVADEPESIWRSIIISGRKNTHTSLPNLKQSTIYSIRVRAFNPVGPSPYSDCITNCFAPVLESLPDEMIFNEGDDVIIEVKFRGIPHPIAMWKRNNAVILPSAKTLFSHDTTSSKLCILNVVPEDSSKIEVLVRNLLGEVSQKVILRVLPIPVPGSSLLVLCSESGKVLLTWKPPVKSINQDIDGFIVEKKMLCINKENSWLELARLEENQFEVEVTNLECEKSYKFRLACFRRNRISEFIVSGIFQYKPRAFTVANRPGKPYVIDYNLQDIKLKWSPPVSDGGKTIENYLIKVKKGKYNFEMTKKFMSVENCEAIVSGFPPKALVSFQICAVNACGQSEMSENSEPHFVKPKNSEPKLNKDLVRDAMVKVGRDFRTEFSASGIPPFDFKWSREGGQIPLDCLPHIEINCFGNLTKLAIKCATAEDSGVYILRVNNDWGNDSISFKVLVLNKPSPPQPPFEIKDLHSTGCHLFWSKPISDGNSPIRYYEVYKHSINYNRWIRIGGEVKETDLLIEGLIPDSRYEFKVMAVNGEGKSSELLSREIIARGQKSDLSQLINITIVDFTAESVTVEWTPSQSAEFIKKFIIQKRILSTLLYQRLESVVFITDQETTGKINRAVISKLKEGHFIQIRVIEIGMSDQKIISECTPFHRIRPKALRPIINSSFSEVKTCRLNSKLEVWVTARGEPFPTFKWSFKGQEITKDTPDFQIAGEENRTCLTISRMKHRHQGTYKLSAMNEHGFDEAETQFVIVSKPPPPRGPITFKLIGEIGAEIIWYKHRYQTYVEKYLIEINEKLDLWESFMQTDKSITKCDFFPRDMNANYKFRIKAVNIAGRSDPVYSKLFNMKELIEEGKRLKPSVKFLSEKVEFNNKEEDTVVYKVGTQVEIKIPFECTEKPEIILYKDGKIDTVLQRFSVKIEETQVVLTKINPFRSDSGRYLIEAKVEGVIDVYPFRLIVVDIPSRPRAPLEVIYLSEDRLFLSWNASQHDGGSPILTYVVERMVDKKGNWKKIYETFDCQCEINVITKPGNYTYRVSAVNQFESSKYLKVTKPFNGNFGKKDQHKTKRGRPRKLVEATAALELSDVSDGSF